MGNEQIAEMLTKTEFKSLLIRTLTEFTQTQKIEKQNLVG